MTERKSRLRPWHALTAIVLIAFGFNVQFAGEKTADAQDTRAGGVRLEDQLTVGLKLRTDEEKEYIAEVIRYVRDGRLPRKLVDKSYVWVRNNRADHPFPLIYFQRILNLQARKLGVQVPIAKFSTGESR